MRIETLDELPAELESIARHCPWATFYHTRTWIESLAESFPKWHIRCLVAREGNDTLGYLPYFEMRRGPARALWSLPFGTYGGPVALEAGEIEKRLVEGFLHERGRFGVYDVGLVDFHSRAGGPGVSVEEVTAHILDLDGGFEVVWKERFDRSKRKETGRAQRLGVTVTEATSLDGVKEYYSIYEKRSTEWRQSFKYPERLFVELVERGHGAVKLFLARAGDRPFGGLLNFYFADAVIAWHGVTSLESRSTEAGTLLLTSSIQDACDNGYRRYNLGGSLGKESLMFYKQALGGVPFEYRVLRWRSFSGKIVSALRARSPAH